MSIGDLFIQKNDTTYVKILSTVYPYNERQKFNIVTPFPIKNTIGKLFWRLFFPPRHRTKNKFRESDRSRFFGFFLEKYPSKEGRGSKVYCL